ncbi:unnamed protein product [Caretta caretta]
MHCPDVFPPFSWDSRVLPAGCHGVSPLQSHLLPSALHSPYEPQGLRQDGHCLLALRNSDANSDNVAWTFSLPYCEPNEINYFFCDISPVLKLACGDTLRKEASILALSVLINLSPFLLVVVSYARILSRIPKTPSAEGRHKAFSTCSSHLTVVTLFYSSACAIYLRPKFNHTVEVDMLISFLFCPRSSAGPCDLQSEEQRGEECPEQTQGKKEVFMNHVKKLGQSSSN